MTLQQLEYIIALDEHRHYVTAADHCYISQPNLTMQVKKLEQEIGIRIFDRDKKPLQPTVIGAQVISRARKILRECRQLKEFVNHEKESMEGEFTIGIIPTLAPYLLPRFLPFFIKENPRVHLNIRELQTSQIISQLESGIIDMGILVTPLSEKNLREIPVFYEPFLLYLPKDHKFVNQQLLLTDELDPSEILVLDEGHCFREQALAICKHESYGSAIGFDYQSGSIEALKSLVKQGVGYTLVPELSVLEEKNSTYIKRFSAPEPVREVSLVVHNSFIKERAIKTIRSNILSVIPEKFIHKQDIVALDWS